MSRGSFKISELENSEPSGRKWRFPLKLPCGCTTEHDTMHWWGSICNYAFKKRPGTIGTGRKADWIWLSKGYFLKSATNLNVPYLCSCQILLAQMKIIVSWPLQEMILCSSLIDTGLVTDQYNLSLTCTWRVDRVLLENHMASKPSIWNFI